MERFELDTQSPVEALVKRAQAYLAEENWLMAESFCHVALDIDEKNIEALLCLLLAEMNVPTKEELGKIDFSFKNNESYVKLTELCNDDLKAEIEKYATEAENAANEAYSAEKDADFENAPAEKNVLVKIILGVALGLILIVGAVLLCINATPYLHKLSEYNNAISILESGEYDLARTAFYKMGNFKDSEKYVSSFSCLPSYTEEIIKNKGKDEEYNRVDYEYEKNGSILKSTVTDREGNVLSTCVNLYDNSGLLISSELSEGDTTISSAFGYNDKGQLEKETATYSSGEKIVYEYVYDENGNNTEIHKTTVYDGKESEIVELYEYSENGLATKCVLTKNGMTISTTTFEYDEYGNRTTATGDNGTSSKYEYLYDIDGNLLKIIEKTYKRGDDLQSEIERNYCDYHYYYKG